MTTVTGGAGANPAPDKDDANGVAGENDLLQLKLHALDPATLTGFTYTLQFPEGKIAIWQQPDKTGDIVSGTTTFPTAEDTTVYVEGLAPSTSMDGEIVSLELHQGGGTAVADSVKIVVAQSMFAIFGDGNAWANSESVLRSYLAGVKKDQRTDPYVIRRDDACYAVFIGNTEKFAKLAISAQDGYVVFNGHSNFGMGLAFSTGLAGISQFMNVGEGLVLINWRYMRDNQGHPAFWIEDPEYGDDPSTAELYDPWVGPANVVGALRTVPAIRFFSNRPSGEAIQAHLTRGLRKYEDWHSREGADRFVIAHSGATDMPTKRWKKLFLNSCNSGPYYYDVFSHGTLFYTTGECVPSVTTKVFLEAIVDGKDNDGILSATVAAQNLDDPLHPNVHDYHSF